MSTDVLWPLETLLCLARLVVINLNQQATGRSTVKVAERNCIVMNPQNEKLKVLLKKLHMTFDLDFNVSGDRPDLACKLIPLPEGQNAAPIDLIGGWIVEELIRQAEVLISLEV